MAEAGTWASAAPGHESIAIPTVKPPIAMPMRFMPWPVVRHFRKSGRMPRVESSRDVDYVAMPRALEQTARNHAAVSALTVDRDRPLLIDSGQLFRKRIERAARHVRDMPRLPFSFAAHVYDVGGAPVPLA